MKTLALIGFGRWGKKYLEIPIRKDSFQIKYVCSPHLSGKKNENNKFIEIDNYKKLFSKKDIDGVIISTSLETHYKIAHDFLSNSFNVLIEKPIAKSVSEVEELYRIANINNCFLLTDYTYLYSPAFQLVKKNLNKIGKVNSVEILFGDSTLIDDSVVWQWGPHVVSIICFLFKKNIPISVSGKKDSKGKNINFVINLKKDVKAFGKIGYGLNFKKRRVNILGDRGSIVFDGENKNKVTLFLKSKRKIIPKYNDISALENLILHFCKSLNNKSEANYIQTDLMVTKTLERLEASTKDKGESKSL